MEFWEPSKFQLLEYDFEQLQQQSTILESYPQLKKLCALFYEFCID